MTRESSSESSSGTPAARVKPLDWAQATGKAAPVAQAIEEFVQRRRRQRWRRGAVAVAGVAVLLTSALVWQRSETAATGTPTPASASAVAGSGATSTRAIVSAPVRRTLPDGSVVELKPGAGIATDFSAEARRVTLMKGEAHFTVAKDARRPFVVTAGGVEVRAIGTAFSVEWGTRDVDVLVTEGIVAVEKPAASAAAATLTEPLARVSAGNRAIVTIAETQQQANVQAVTPVQLSQRLAWRVPRLEFNATPLSEVVELFNQHALPQPGGRAAQLVLADEKLRALPLSGTLRADNVAVLLQILESSYGIVAEREAGGEIVLRAGK